MISVYLFLTVAGINQQAGRDGETCKGCQVLREHFDVWAKEAVISFNDILYELNAFHIPHSQHRDVRYHTERDRDTMKSVIIMNKHPLCFNH